MCGREMGQCTKFYVRCSCNLNKEAIMAKVTEYSTVTETPIRVILTPQEMKNILKALKHSLETNPQLYSWSPEARLYDEFSEMLNSTYERLKDDSQYRIKYDANTGTSELVMSERDKTTKADAELAEV